MKGTGPRLGWWIGGIGGLLWLPIMAIIWLVQGSVVAPVLGGFISLAGVVYLLLFAPWRHPTTPMRTLYLGFIVILLAGAAVTVGQYWQSIREGEGIPLLALVTLFIPVLTIGHKSWSDLHRHDE